MVHRGSIWLDRISTSYGTQPKPNLPYVPEVRSNDTSCHISHDWFFSVPCIIYTIFSRLVSLPSAGEVFLPVYKTGHPSAMGENKPSKIDIQRLSCTRPHVSCNSLAWRLIRLVPGYDHPLSRNTVNLPQLL